MYSGSRSSKRRRISGSGASISTQNDILIDQSFNNETAQQDSGNKDSSNHSQDVIKYEVVATSNVTASKQGFVSAAGDDASFGNASSNLSATGNVSNQENKSTIANAAKENIKRKISSALDKVKKNFAAVYRSPIGKSDTKELDLEMQSPINNVAKKPAKAKNLTKLIAKHVKDRKHSLLGSNSKSNESTKSSNKNGSNKSTKKKKKPKAVRSQRKKKNSASNSKGSTSKKKTQTKTKTKRKSKSGTKSKSKKSQKKEKLRVSKPKMKNSIGKSNNNNNIKAKPAQIKAKTKQAAKNICDINKVCNSYSCIAANKQAPLLQRQHSNNNYATIAANMNQLQQQQQQQQQQLQCQRNAFGPTQCLNNVNGYNCNQLQYNPNYNLNILNSNNNDNSNKYMRLQSRAPKYSYDEKGYIVYEKGLLMNNRFEIVKPLGKGTFSKVFMCNDLLQGGKKAVKVIRNVDKYQAAAKTEAKILQFLKDNDKRNNFAIIHVCEIAYYQAHPIFVFPLYGRSLYRFIADNQFQPLPKHHVKSIVKQITKAVAYVHALGIIITDLKPENMIIVDDSVHTIINNGRLYHQLIRPEIKLIDFGSAIFDRNKWHTHLIQTWHYRAPEVMFKFNWSFSADIWSVGCIVVELIYGKMLFNTHDTIDHLNQIITCIGEIPSYMFQMIDDATYNQLFQMCHDGDVLNLSHAKISPTQCSYLEQYFGLPKNYYKLYLKSERIKTRMALLMQQTRNQNMNASESNVIIEMESNDKSTNNKNSSENEKIDINCNYESSGTSSNDCSERDLESIESEFDDISELYEEIGIVSKKKRKRLQMLRYAKQQQKEAKQKTEKMQQHNSESQQLQSNAKQNSDPQNAVMQEYEKLEQKLKLVNRGIFACKETLQLYDLTRKMLTWDANQRITAREALRHEYFSSTPKAANLNAKSRSKNGSNSNNCCNRSNDRSVSYHSQQHQLIATTPQNRNKTKTKF